MVRSLREKQTPRTAPLPPGVAGIVRLGRRTKALAPTLSPGAIVVLDHPDLDTVAAHALIAAKPAAIVNVQPFVTGRYPNRGPSALLDAKIPLFETTDDLFSLLKDSEPLKIHSDALFRDGVRVANLSPLGAQSLSERLAAARANLDRELSHFTENTLRFLNRDNERALLLDPIDLPETRAPIAGRHVLIAVRGDGYEEDIARLRSYLREQKPVVIAVDGAADALIAAAIRPDIILGDMDSVSDAALRCGAQLIVHAYPKDQEGASPRAPGMERIGGLKLDASVFPIAGTSEDAALLLAYEKGADLIVAVGTHTNLEDFLDKGRGGMASTFLVRLKVGSRLVDARGVSKLYAARKPSAPAFVFLALSALFPVIVLLASTPFGQIAWRSIVVWFRIPAR